MATNSTRGNAKIWFIGGGVVAAAALVIFLRNYPPAPADAAGTVGAAQRYSSTQITKNDVTVAPDALTTWLQSDTFDKIVKDPEAREIFTNAAFLQVAMDATAKNFLEIGNVTSHAVNAVIGDKAVREALHSESVKVLIDDARIQELLATDASKVVLDPAVQAAMLKDESVKVVFENGAILQFLSEASKVATLRGDAAKVGELQGDASKVGYLRGDAAKVGELQGDAAKVGYLRGDASKVTLSEAVNFLTTDSAKVFADNASMLQTALNNDAVLQAIKNGAFMQAVSNGAVRDALVEEARKAKNND